MTRARYPRAGGGLGPLRSVPATHVLLAPAGVLLLITSRGLGRRDRPAWWLAAGLLGLSVLLHLLRGPHHAAAVVTGPVTVALQRLFPDSRKREQAADIVRRWGSDTLAPFALRPDKEWFVMGETLIAYPVVRGVALVSGDPVGPPGVAGPVILQAWADLPRVPVAAMAAEGYLPYASLIRGRNWSPAPGAGPLGPAVTSDPPMGTAGTGPAPVCAYPQRS